jgi:long-chain acyl-CoA synthetase
VATGDLGTVAANGSLRIVGRKKDAVITPIGTKVHPGEAERLLESCPEVKRAVVINDSRQGNEVVAIVFAPQASDADIRALLTKHLQCVQTSIDYRIHRVVIANEEPSVENGLLTNNMKINRTAITRKYLLEGAGERGRA